MTKAGRPKKVKVKTPALQSRLDSSTALVDELEAEIEKRESELKILRQQRDALASRVAIDPKQEQELRAKLGLFFPRDMEAKLAYVGDAQWRRHVKPLLESKPKGDEKFNATKPEGLEDAVSQGVITSRELSHIIGGIKASKVTGHYDGPAEYNSYYGRTDHLDPYKGIERIDVQKHTAEATLSIDSPEPDISSVKDAQGNLVIEEME